MTNLPEQPKDTDALAPPAPAARAITAVAQPALAVRAA